MIINLKTIKKVYINLDRDIQRKNQFEISLNELGYENYERFSARLLPKQRAFNHGCSQSHLDLMKQYKNNLPLFVLEDDAKKTEWYSEYVNDDGKLEIPDDADAIYVGYSTGGCWKTIGVDFYPEHYNKKWMRLKHCLATHAIIFLKNIDAFISNAEYTIKNKIPLDVGYAKEVLPMLRIYAPTKPLFYQWDKCWPTTNVNVDTEKKEWISYKEDGSINMIRKVHL